MCLQALGRAGDTAWQLSHAAAAVQLPEPGPLAQIAVSNSSLAVGPCQHRQGFAAGSKGSRAR